MTWVMILQLLIVLGALWVGSRYGSLALGAIAGRSGFAIFRHHPNHLSILIQASMANRVARAEVAHYWFP